jgi:type IV pilus assembly protein PilV
MVVTSIGLLGIAGLIAASLKNNHGSYARTQAAMLSNDIVDRMRANRTIAEGSPSPYNLALGVSPSGSGVVNTDLTEWRAALAQSMPEGTGSVSFAPATNNVTVVVQWNDSRSTTDGATIGLKKQTVTLETHL